MTNARIKKQAKPLSIAGLVVCMGCVWALAISSSAADSSDREQASNQTKTSVPAALQGLVGTEGGVVDDYGLDVSGAWRTQPPGSSREVWITPGEDGAACISLADGAASCGSGADVAQGLLTLAIMPPPPPEVGRALIDAQAKGLSPAETQQVVRAAMRASAPAAAPATFIGLVPETMTSATLLSTSGKVLAEAPVQKGVYELRVTDITSVRPGKLFLEKTGHEEPAVVPMS